jgi:hypothetical protein
VDGSVSERIAKAPSGYWRVRLILRAFEVEPVTMRLVCDLRA